MEMNPFTLDHEFNPFPLDMRGELDDTAAFKSAKKWGALEFPLPFGRTMTAAEEYVHTLDSNTGWQLLSFLTSVVGQVSQAPVPKPLIVSYVFCEFSASWRESPIPNPLSETSSKCRCQSSCLSFKIEVLMQLHPELELLMCVAESCTR